jgi:alpha-tubulin suppressor-like RCC1 family protein
MRSAFAVAGVTLLIVGCSGDLADPAAGTDPVADSETRSPPVVKLDLPLVGLSAGGGHTCAVSNTGATYCWGANTYGELGNGTSEPSTVPVLVQAPAPFRIVSTDGFVRWPEYGVEPYPWAAYSCGLDGKGIAYCWGDMTYGQLGTGVHPCPECSWPQTFTPQIVLGGPYAQLSAGDRHACTLTPGGAVYCWGDRSGIAGPWNRPSPVVGLPALIAAVSAGGDHTCVLTFGGEVFCWGSNRWGQIGTGAPGLHERQAEPVRVPGPAFASLFAGDNGTCGVTAAGRAYCWGRNDAGQLGNGEVRPVCTTDSNTHGCETDPSGPQRVSGSIPFTALAVGQFHTCGLDDQGRAYCWGAREQLGRSGGTSEVPDPVETDLRFVRLAAGARHTCGIAVDGMAYCWGEGRFGQLGAGTHRNSLLPTAVSDRR